MIEAPLLLRLQDYEVRHDAIVNYVFEVFMMIQKQCFTLIASAFTNYSDNVDMAGAPSLPLILNHGNRSDVDDVLAAITKQDATERERERTAAADDIRHVCVFATHAAECPADHAAAYAVRHANDAAE